MDQFKMINTIKSYPMLDFPETIPIDTVSFCNLKCSMCITKDSKRKKGFMDWDLYTKIIDEIASENKNTRIFMVFSGEPLLRAKHKKNIFEMVEYAKSKGLNELLINTNGCLLTNDNAKKILTCGLKQIFIGIDAFSEDVYNQNRCGGNYQQTVENVLNLLKLKKELNLEYPIIECQFIEMENNIHQKQDFIDFWTKHGAVVKVRPMCTWAGQSSKNILIKPLEQKDRFPCYWAMTTMVITHTGQVPHCACDLNVTVNNGNVQEKSIKEIWNTTLKEFRLKHFEHRFSELSNLCKNCHDWQATGSYHYQENKIDNDN